MININGKQYVGNNLTINNGRVIIDGKDISVESKDIKIDITGNVDKLDVDYCNAISIVGNVNIAKSSSGDISITGNVTNSVETMSGDVKCGNIAGSVKTMSGDIKYNKTI